MAEHGTYNSYVAGCRSECCLSAARAYWRGYRRRVKSGELVPDLVAEHGDYGRYKVGCRCALCREANAEYMRVYRNNKALEDTS